MTAAKFAFECTNYMKNNMVATQHCLCNFIVNVSKDGKTAVSEIGFTAHHWKNVDGCVKDAGSNGRYLDKWTLCPDGNFRICERTLIYDMESRLWDAMMKAETAKTGKGERITEQIESRQDLVGKHSMEDISYKLFGRMDQ